MRVLPRSKRKILIQIYTKPPAVQAQNSDPKFYRKAAIKQIRTRLAPYKILSRNYGLYFVAIKFRAKISRFEIPKIRKRSKIHRRRKLQQLQRIKFLAEFLQLKFRALKSRALKSRKFPNFTNPTHKISNRNPPIKIPRLKIPQIPASKAKIPQIYQALNFKAINFVSNFKDYKC